MYPERERLGMRLQRQDTTVVTQHRQSLVRDSKSGPVPRIKIDKSAD